MVDANPLSRRIHSSLVDLCHRSHVTNASSGSNRSRSRRRSLTFVVVVVVVPDDVIVAGIKLSL